VVLWAAVALIGLLTALSHVYMRPVNPKSPPSLPIVLEMIGLIGIHFKYVFVGCNVLGARFLPYGREEKKEPSAREHAD